MRYKNFSFREPPFQEHAVVDGGNFMQIQPDTEICKTIVNLTITGGNFTNCKAQPTWNVTGGNWTQIKWCSHEHPRLIEKGLPECEVDCVHKSKDKVSTLVSEEEYRKAKEEGLTVNINKYNDLDGVTIQEFEVEDWEYTSKVTGHNKPWDTVISISKDK